MRANFLTLDGDTKSSCNLISFPNLSELNLTKEKDESVL